jgi:hypothetical protein
MHNPRKDDRQSVQPCSPGSRQMTIVYKTCSHSRPLDHVGTHPGPQTCLGTLVKARNGSQLRVQSDPHAESFHLRMGCRKVGELESSSIPGRMLPLLVYDIESNLGS